MNNDFLRLMNRGEYDPKQYHDDSPVGYVIDDVEWEGPVDTRTAEEKDQHYYQEILKKAVPLAEEAHHKNQAYIPKPMPIESHGEVSTFEIEN